MNKLICESPKCDKILDCFICRACREHCTEHPRLLRHRTANESALTVWRAIEYSRELARKRGETPTF